MNFDNIGTLMRLPTEIRLSVLATLDEAGEHKALAMLGQTSRAWRSVVAENPWLRVSSLMLVPGTAPSNESLNLCRARLRGLVELKCPWLLSRFLVDLAAQSEAAMAIVNEVSEDSLTPLMSAARIGAFGVAKVLVCNGAQANTRDSIGYTAARWAALGKFHMCAVWLTAAASLHGAVAASAPVTLSQALERGHVLMARQLLSAVAAPLSTELMYEAVKSGTIGVVQVLMEFDLGLAARSVGPAMKAIQTLHDPLPLIALVAPHLSQDHKRAVIRAAAMCGATATARYLLTLPEVTIDDRDADGKTPLYHAADGGHDVLVAAFVIEAGARHDIAANDQTTPLFAAISRLARIEWGDDGYDSYSYVVHSTNHTKAAQRLVQLEYTEAAVREALRACAKVREDVAWKKCTTATRVLADLDSLEGVLNGKLPSKPNQAAKAPKEKKKVWFWSKSHASASSAV